MLGKLIKFLIFLTILGIIALIGYAYVGPFFGADFAPQPVETRVPVTLDTE